MNIRAYLYSEIPLIAFGTVLFGPLLFKDTIIANTIEYEYFGIEIPQGPGSGMTIAKGSCAIIQGIRKKVQLHHFVDTDEMKAFK